MSFQIQQQGTLLAQQAGQYISFPTLTRDPQSNHVIVQYRKGEAPSDGGHGGNGNLYTILLDPATMACGPETLLYSYQQYPPNMIDGVVTRILDTLHVLLRTYPNHPSTYYTRGSSLDSLNTPIAFQNTSEFNLWAEWGHMQPLADGRLLQIFYGGYPLPDGTKQASVCVYQSYDDGQTWQFLGWVVNSPDIPGNETALINHQGVLHTAIRTAPKIYPGPLYLTQSRNGGQTWDPPFKSTLCGEAPMFYTLPSGQVLMNYRGYNETAPENGGTFSLVTYDPNAQSFGVPFVVEAYAGDHYDGGYGDMIWLPERNQLLTVYYYSDNPNVHEPWLRYSLIDVDNAL